MKVKTVNFGVDLGQVPELVLGRLLVLPPVAVVDCRVDPLFVGCCCLALYQSSYKPSQPLSNSVSLLKNITAHVDQVEGGLPRSY